MPINRRFKDYMRNCRRCGIIFHTKARCGRICVDCLGDNYHSRLIKQAEKERLKKLNVQNII